MIQINAIADFPDIVQKGVTQQVLPYPHRPVIDHQNYQPKGNNAIDSFAHKDAVCVKTVQHRYFPIKIHTQGRKHGRLYYSFHPLGLHGVVHDPSVVAAYTKGIERIDHQQWRHMAKHYH